MGDRRIFAVVPGGHSDFYATEFIDEEKVGRSNFLQYRVRECSCGKSVPKKRFVGSTGIRAGDPRCDDTAVNHVRGAAF